MKNLLNLRIFVSLFICIFIFSIKNNHIFAQKISKNDKKLAKQLCDCSEITFKDIPKFMKELFIDMGELGEEKASIKFMEKMGKFTDQERKEMEDFAKKNEKENKDMSAQIKAQCESPEREFDKKTEKEKSDILAYMQKDKKCRLGHAIQKIKLKNKKEEGVKEIKN